MSLILSAEHERIVNEEVRAGHYGSAEEVIARALTALREKGRVSQGHRRDPKRAADRIRERRKGVTLGGLKIKDLIEEGRR